MTYSGESPVLTLDTNIHIRWKEICVPNKH